MQRKQERHDGRDEEECAKGVEAENLLADGGGWMGLFGHSQEEEHEDEGDGADGEVEVEAPSPSCALGEGSADEGAGNTGDAEYEAEHGCRLGDVREFVPRAEVVWKGLDAYLETWDALEEGSGES